MKKFTFLIGMRTLLFYTHTIVVETDPKESDDVEDESDISDEDEEYSDESEEESEEEPDEENVKVIRVSDLVRDTDLSDDSDDDDWEPRVNIKQDPLVTVETASIEAEECLEDTQEIEQKANETPSEIDSDSEPDDVSYDSPDEFPKRKPLPPGYPTYHVSRFETRRGEDKCDSDSDNSDIDESVFMQMEVKETKNDIVEQKTVADFLYPTANETADSPMNHEDNMKNFKEFMERAQEEHKKRMQEMRDIFKKD